MPFAERQRALRHSRALGAQRLAALARADTGRALARCFIVWASKVAAGFHMPMLRDVRPEHLGPSTPVPMPPAYADGHAMLKQALDARAAECMRLSAQCRHLEGALALQHAQQEALRRSATRASCASRELLEARREQARLAASLAQYEARAAGESLARGALAVDPHLTQ